jgi:hypothetical protein
MDLIKLYLTQSISTAANNLRLNSQQIEIISLLKETLFNLDKTETVIRKMKKITELSTLAIKLDEICIQLNEGPIDLSRLSDRFKLHSQNLVKDLFVLLNNSNLSKLKALFEKIKNESVKKIEVKSPDETLVDLKEREGGQQEKIAFKESEELQGIKEETQILPEENLGNNTFENFEKSILEPIKTIDTMLQQLSGNSNLPENFRDYSDIMEKNSQLSIKNGFEILAGLHSIVADSVKLIYSGKITPEKETIENMRACLIVIAAIVKGKEVDITNYLNKAEQFGNNIKLLKMKDEK